MTTLDEALSLQPFTVEFSSQHPYVAFESNMMNITLRLTQYSIRKTQYDARFPDALARPMHFKDNLRRAGLKPGQFLHFSKKL